MIILVTSYLLKLVTVTLRSFMPALYLQYNLKLWQEIHAYEVIYAWTPGIISGDKGKQ